MGQRNNVLRTKQYKVTLRIAEKTTQLVPGKAAGYNHSNASRHVRCLSGGRDKSNTNSKFVQVLLTSGLGLERILYQRILFNAGLPPGSSGIGTGL